LEVDDDDDEDALEVEDEDDAAEDGAVDRVEEVDEVMELEVERDEDD